MPKLLMSHSGLGGTPGDGSHIFLESLWQQFGFSGEFPCPFIGKRQRSFIHEFGSDS